MSAITKPRSREAVAPAPAWHRQAAAFGAFALVYFGLAAYAAVLPLHTQVPLFIWPAHGVALGALLIAPARRWPVYLLLVAISTAFAGALAGEGMTSTLRTAIVGILEPLVVAAGLKRLAEPRVQIDTVRGLASFLVGMVPLVAVMAVGDAAFSFIAFDAPFRQRWSMMFVSTMLGMLLTAPLILAWSRENYREAYEVTRARMPELLVMLVILVVITHLVFAARAGRATYIPEFAYLCAPILIWAALRFGLRTATLALALFGLIAYWHTGQGLGPGLDPGDPKALLYLQGYLATIIVTTLFSSALLVERQDAERETAEWRYRHERVIRASASLLYDFDPGVGNIVWDGDVPGVLGTTMEQIATLRQWMSRVHPDDRMKLKGLREQLLKGEISHIAMEYRFQRDDQEFITLGVNAYRIADTRLQGGQRVIGFVK